MANEFKEGKQHRGGVNRQPQTERPSPPKGQGGAIAMIKDTGNWHLTQSVIAFDGGAFFDETKKETGDADDTKDTR